VPRSVSCVTAGAWPHKTVWSGRQEVSGGPTLYSMGELTISQGGAVGKTPMLMLRKAVQYMYRQHDADTAALSTEIHVL